MSSRVKKPLVGSVNSRRMAAKVQGASTIASYGHTAPHDVEPLEYWGCAQRFREGFYGVFVPDVEDAAGAGESPEEALAAAKEKLACELSDIPQHQRPLPSDEATATAKARKVVEDDAGEFIHEEEWHMVKVQVDFSLVKKLTAAELEQLQKKYGPFS